MKKITIGILAHVDAGKTTLSESLLYLTGEIKKPGRVDNKDAFLDTFTLEQNRGITIFSKQAELVMGSTGVTLLDTPGHVDFSAETERTLQVLDYAVLVISGSDGVQGHTLTLWHLLSKYQVPVFIFVNKMDMDGANQAQLMEELKRELGECCLDFTDTNSEKFLESAAMCSEKLLEQYMETGSLKNDNISSAIRNREMVPCYFGSALKIEGVEEFIKGMDSYTQMPEYPSSFGARIFKITRDEQGNRLTYMKITGGSLRVKDVVTGDGWEDKVNQIRIYSGTHFGTIECARAGVVCAVTGLAKSEPGGGVGFEKEKNSSVLEPVLTYRVLLPEDLDAAQVLPNFLELEEEEPQLHVVWNSELQEIQVQIMGEVQLEVLQTLIQERFGVPISFDAGRIAYKESIKSTVEGVGHYEPLRHYAEVHLLLEPLETGSGLVFDTDLREDLLDKNWQRLILTHLAEKEHLGVLTGSPITDMKITLVAGRAHLKHTEGGDFRQATYRAVRQGLMQAESVLLEPYYEFRMELPEDSVGRAMSDVERMKGNFEVSYEGDKTILVGRAPVSEMNGYQREFVSYTKGYGKFFCLFKGYEPCHNAEEVISEIGYNAEADTKNPCGSVFCSHGAGFLVKWQEVKEYMHLESVFCPEKAEDAIEDTRQNRTSVPYLEKEDWIGEDEIEAIYKKAFYANARESDINREKIRNRKSAVKAEAASYKGKKNQAYKEEYLLVDGYNIIFAWEELKELAEGNIDAARGKLLDIMSNFQGMRNGSLIVVFDAYRVKGHDTEIFDYHNIHVVFTKEAETADAYIEKFAHDNREKYRITVATSDGLEQIIIRGQGCTLLSARELKLEVERVAGEIREEYLK